MTDGVNYNEAPHRVFRRASRRRAAIAQVAGERKVTELTPGLDAWYGLRAVDCGACGTEHRAGYYRRRYLIEDCPGCGLEGLK